MTHPSIHSVDALRTGESQPPEGLLGAHEFEIIHDLQRARGWYLKWQRKRLGCDSRGNMTIPQREQAMELFSLIAEKHCELVSSTGEETSDDPA